MRMFNEFILSSINVLFWVIVVYFWNVEVLNCKLVGNEVWKLFNWFWVCLRVVLLIVVVYLLINIWVIWLVSEKMCVMYGYGFVRVCLLGVVSGGKEGIWFKLVLYIFVWLVIWVMLVFFCRLKVYILLIVIMVFIMNNVYCNDWWVFWFGLLFDGVWFLKVLRFLRVLVRSIWFGMEWFI